MVGKVQNQNRKRRLVPVCLVIHCNAIETCFVNRARQFGTTGANFNKQRHVCASCGDIMTRQGVRSQRGWLRRENVGIGQRLRAQTPVPVETQRASIRGLPDAILRNVWRWWDRRLFVLSLPLALLVELLLYGGRRSRVRRALGRTVF